MRIGHYTLGYGLHGGVGSYLRRLSAAQRELGHEVLIFDGAANSTDKADQPIVHVEGDDDLLAQARHHAIDLLHVHTLIRLPAGAVDVPIVRTLHGHEPYCPSGGRFLARSQAPCSRAYSLTGCMWGHLRDHCGSLRPTNLLGEFRRVREEMAHTSRLTVVTVSEYLRQQMIRSGYDARRVRAIALPAPAARQASAPPTDGVPRFVFLGRLTPHKGVDWLLRGMARVRTPIHLDIAGEGNCEHELKALATTLGLSDRVTFHGWVDPTRVNALLADARTLVFPSIWQEPAGLVSFEAAACGRAVIASNVGGISEMVFHDSTGLLVAPNDDLALAGAMEKLANDYSTARRLGAEGHRLIPERFSMSRHLQALHTVYAQVIASVRPEREAAREPGAIA